MTAATGWRLPLSAGHRLAASAGALSFVGGAGDFDAAGTLRHGGDVFAQVPGAMQNLAAALASESCGLADVVRLKVYYSSDGSVDEWQLAAALLQQIEHVPAPTLSLLPVSMQPFAGQALQIQAIARRGWREQADVRVVYEEVPHEWRDAFADGAITSGLRAGEFISTASRVAMAQATAAAPDAVAQTHTVMRALGETLARLGASLQDAIKMEGYYFGTTREHWAPMAQTRGEYFRDPGPVATVVPCPLLWPDGAATRIELLAMRQTRDGFDKYIPREDCWPARVWDWPIPLPYRQAIRLRDTIWLGGQVPAHPYRNLRERVLPGEAGPQVAFTMSYIEDLLRGFERRARDLQLAVCYFRSDGDPAATRRFVDTLGECIGGTLPPLTLVPLPHLHTPETTVEIWGVAS